MSTSDCFLSPAFLLAFSSLFFYLPFFFLCPSSFARALKVVARLFVPNKERSTSSETFYGDFKDLYNSL